MLTSILSFLLDSKMIKTSVASAAGSGVVLVGIMQSHVQDIKKDVDFKNSQMIKYVDAKHDIGIEKFKSLFDNQTEIKDQLKVIDNRLYNINKRLKE